MVRAAWCMGMAAALLMGGCQVAPRAVTPVSNLVTPVQAVHHHPEVPVPSLTVEQAAQLRWVAPRLYARPVRVDLSALQTEVNQYLSKQEGVWGLMVWDLSSGRSFGVNPDMPFPAASTFKLPLVMYALDQIYTGKADWAHRLTYSLWADYEEGTGVLAWGLLDGDTVSLRECIELAIKESDNVAVNMMLRHFGRANVEAFMTRLGGKTLRFENTNGTTPREMAGYLRAAWGAPYRIYLFKLLSNTAFRDRTQAGVPEGVRVAHKIGTLPGSVNDIAMVYAPRRNFILSIFSKEVWETDGAEVIKAVTEMVYRFEYQLGLESAPVPAAPPLSLSSATVRARQ